MIKRPSSSPPPSSSSTIAEVDHNGKRKKHTGSLHRYMIINGKLIVIIITALLSSVFLIPPIKIIMQQSTTIQSNGSSNTNTQQLKIPPCPNNPWKEGEDLRGKCPGDLKPFSGATSISTCASTCCDNSECISWQYRKDVGCLQGKDVRLGQEKDGVAAWCSDHPPYRWNGAYLKVHKEKHKGMEDSEVRRKGCNKETWNPNEEIGQCFGLGDVKSGTPSISALDCMEACCASEKCHAWQWNKELGCFYSGGMHGCQENLDPITFEPFVGRRKYLATRKYIDKHNKPWQMTI